MLEISFFHQHGGLTTSRPTAWNLGFRQGGGLVLDRSPRPGAFSHLSPQLSARPAVECLDGFDLQQGETESDISTDAGSGAEARAAGVVLAPAPAWTSLLLSWDWRPVSSWLMARADAALAARQAWAREEPRARVATRRLREA